MPNAATTGAFLRLGFTSFGGPAAHVAMMHEEVVTKRKWLSDQEFLDLLGATNLIPGPNSTEMAHHIGYLRAGWPGMLVAGISFIAPAMLMVMALAYLYVRFNSLPEVEGLLYGIKPVVIAIIAQALWSLGYMALKNAGLVLLGMIILALYFLGINEVGLLIGAGILLLILKALQSPNGGGATTILSALGIQGFAVVAAQPFSLTVLFITFVKIGAVLYGSGYVLLAFLHADFVERLGWLTDRQLLDAVAIGQFTPGPLFTTATFIGYLLGGAPAALVATVGIFLPSFIFVLLSNPWVVRLRNSTLASAFLDGVNAAAIALMAAVTWQLAQASIVDIPALVITVVAFVLLFRFKVNSVWLVLGGAIAGLISTLFG